METSGKGITVPKRGGADRTSFGGEVLMRLAMERRYPLTAADRTLSGGVA